MTVMTDDDSIAAIAACSTAGRVDDSSCVLTFDDGSRLELFDFGQSCCERRYMSTDDNPADIIGARLLDVVESDGNGYIVPDPAPDDYGFSDCHDVAFVRITTTNGPLVLVNHNEHNGYYGGFGLVATLQKGH
jgi:hypothetical protein